MNMSHEVFTCHYSQLLNSSASIAEICQFCHCALTHEKSFISHYCFLQLATLFTSLPVDADITSALSDSLQLSFSTHTLLLGSFSSKSDFILIVFVCYTFLAPSTSPINDVTCPSVTLVTIMDVNTVNE
jgi:hypothetical protein